MRRGGFTLLEAAVVVGIVAILAAILAPVFSRTRCNESRYYCQTHLKQITFAIAQYRQDSDDVLPITNSGGGWALELLNYGVVSSAFHCPSRPEARVPEKPWRRGYSDYYLNSRVAGFARPSIPAPDRTILLGEGNDGWDYSTASYHYPEPPTWWRTDKSSPMYWHTSGASYAFVDGHVKWLREPDVSLSAPGPGIYTFLAK